VIKTFTVYHILGDLEICMVSPTGVVSGKEW
jgi:hypothetical protein